MCVCVCVCVCGLKSTFCYFRNDAGVIIGLYTGLYKVAYKDWTFFDGSKLNHIVHAAMSPMNVTQDGCLLIFESNTTFTTQCSFFQPFICKAPLGLYLSVIFFDSAVKLL